MDTMHEIVKNVKKRGYLALPPEATLVAQLLKMQEELGEAIQHTGVVITNAAEWMRHSGSAAAHLFDRIHHDSDWTKVAYVTDDEAFLSELADVAVVFAVLREFARKRYNVDLLELGVQKSHKDVKRRVR